MNVKNLISNSKGFLIDIDGTLYFKGSPINGAIETVRKLKKSGRKLLFLTNTDSKTPITVLRMLQDSGFEIKIDEIFTPIIALKEFLSKYPNKLCFFVTTEEIADEFKKIPQVHGSEIPEFVIIGDFRDNWDVNRLNKAFRFVLKGANILGTQGNRYFLDQNGEPVLDTGSFTQLIAHAANKSSKIFGKPSKEYFTRALMRLNLNNEEVLVVGDDLESDIQGALNANIKALLVKTGKSRDFNDSISDIKPNAVLNSFSSISSYL